jgi:hypothetical protein
MRPSRNVNPEIHTAVAGDRLATELAGALAGMFTIEYHKRLRKYDATYTLLHCKPTRSVGEMLLLSREVLAIIANFDDAQVRTLHLAKDRIERSAGRLDPALLIVVHADRRGDEKLRSWGREVGLKVIPIFRPRAGALPTAEILRRNLATELFSMDPFQVTGPVVNDMDFYGRGNDAMELLRQLQAGRIRAMFGIRKIGKTSLINRVVGLAKDAGSPRIAMVDCSVDDFNKLRADEALRAVAKAIRLAAHRGYAHVSEALKKSDAELVPTFDDLWAQSKGSALGVVFDEVDYITPASPTSPHWRTDFNRFWREFRVVHQEAQRQGAPLAVLVAGVSSHAFRVENIDGAENSALHFVPEEYLAPFARDATRAMLRDLERRCGLLLVDGDRDLLAEACGDFPYWVRMAGSYIHKGLEISGRPYAVRSEILHLLLDEFVVAEGADMVRVGLQDLGRKYPEIIEQLQETATKKSVSLAEGRLLVRYGLASQRGSVVEVRSALVKSALDQVALSPAVVESEGQGGRGANDRLQLSTEEWAEELAVISRRRNLLERSLREYVRVVLKVHAGKERPWTDVLLQSLSTKRRPELAGLAGDALLPKIYWMELDQVIGRHWELFEATFGDKKHFQLAMRLLNDRPDAHAKPVDAADLALYRRELSWMEERLA